MRRKTPRGPAPALPAALAAQRAPAKCPQNAPNRLWQSTHPLPPLRRLHARLREHERAPLRHDGGLLRLPIGAGGPPRNGPEGPEVSSMTTSDNLQVATTLPVWALCRRAAPTGPGRVSDATYRRPYGRFGLVSQRFVGTARRSDVVCVSPGKRPAQRITTAATLASNAGCSVPAPVCPSSSGRREGGGGGMR